MINILPVADSFLDDLNGEIKFNHDRNNKLKASPNNPKMIVAVLKQIQLKHLHIKAVLSSCLHDTIIYTELFVYLQKQSALATSYQASIPAFSMCKLKLTAAQKFKK